MSLFIFARLMGLSVSGGRKIERRLLTYSETTLALDVGLDQVSPLKDVLDEQHLDGPVLRTRSSETEFVDA